MKRDWLLYLVIFSLALNVGTISTFAYLRYQDRQESAVKEELPPLPIREMWRRLNLDEEQRRCLREMLPEHRRRMRALRWDLAEKRRELLDLLKKETSPDWPTVQNKIKDISNLQGKLEEEILQHLLAMKKQLKPEQQAAFVELMEKRLRPFEGRRGPRWKHHGPPREMGPGPGPGCPPPPPVQGAR